MIVIFSEKKDGSTNKVMNWLAARGHEALRLNVEDAVELIEWTDKGLLIETKGQMHFLSPETTSVYNS